MIVGGALYCCSVVFKRLFTAFESETSSSIALWSPSEDKNIFIGYRFSLLYTQEYIKIQMATSLAAEKQFLTSNH